jgi:hypothetical protein
MRADVVCGVMFCCVSQQEKAGRTNPHLVGKLREHR